MLWWLWSPSPCFVCLPVGWSVHIYASPCLRFSKGMTSSLATSALLIFVRMISIPLFCGCITVPRNFHCDTTSTTEVDIFCNPLPFISLGNSGHTSKSIGALVTSVGPVRSMSVPLLSPRCGGFMSCYITMVPN
ncbi:hypothetical protein EV421DRAFT_1769725 [Armillaria borealis]|uniref:Uncharacterized protein n=1 Tax=Armillaria borealis TaxID=47425 RepID=A0AA39K128_9AGAR|nr:hypothetical protein EV421DRAFT_1769725 [Armillaria borealis]